MGDSHPPKRGSKNPSYRLPIHFYIVPIDLPLPGYVPRIKQRGHTPHRYKRERGREKGREKGRKGEQKKKRINIEDVKIGILINKGSQIIIIK